MFWMLYCKVHSLKAIAEFFSQQALFKELGDICRRMANAATPCPQDESCMPMPSANPQDTTDLILRLILRRRWGPRKPQEAPESHRQSQEAPGVPRRPQEASGSSKKPREAPGASRRLQEIQGGPRNPQEALGVPRTPQEATGGPRKLQEVAGSSRRLQESPGRFRKPQEAPGGARTFPGAQRAKSVIRGYKIEVQRPSGFPGFLTCECFLSILANKRGMASRTFVFR